MARIKELQDFSTEELSQIPLGSAGILKQLSPAVRRDPEVRRAAKEKPAEFRRVIAGIAPGQAIEPRVRVVSMFDLSLWKVIEERWNTVKETDPEIVTFEDFVEFLVCG